MDILKENGTLFNLIKKSLYSGLDGEIAKEDLPDVYYEMKQQAIVAIPYYWLKTNNFPIDSDWICDCHAVIGRWLQVMSGQDEILRLLEENGVSAVIIKGAAAAMYYPHPFLRSSGDVDILVKRTEMELAANILEKQGYRILHEKNGDTLHYSYEKNGIVYELHRRPSGVKLTDENLITLFEEGICHKEWVEVNGFRVPVLPKDLNGLILLLHINGHLSRGIGLRQIIDWMMYLNHTTEEEWTYKLFPSIIRANKNELALVVTAMCIKYMGLRCSFVDNEMVESETVDLLMLYVLDKGNMGRKSIESTKGRIVYMTTQLSNPKKIIRIFQSSGLNHCEMTRKNGLFRPFAFFYRVGMAIKELISSRITPIQFYEQYKKGKKQRALLEKLEIEV